MIDDDDIWGPCPRDRIIQGSYEDVSVSVPDKTQFGNNVMSSVLENTLFVSWIANRMQKNGYNTDVTCQICKSLIHSTRIPDQD